VRTGLSSAFPLAPFHLCHMSSTRRIISRVVGDVLQLITLLWVPHFSPRSLPRAPQRGRFCLSCCPSSSCLSVTSFPGPSAVLLHLHPLARGCLPISSGSSPIRPPNFVLSLPPRICVPSGRNEKFCEKFTVVKALITFPFLIPWCKGVNENS